MINFGQLSSFIINVDQTMIINKPQNHQPIMKLRPLRSLHKTYSSTIAHEKSDLLQPYRGLLRTLKSSSSKLSVQRNHPKHKQSQKALPLKSSLKTQKSIKQFGAQEGSKQKIKRNTINTLVSKKQHLVINSSNTIPMNFTETNKGYQGTKQKQSTGKKKLVKNKKKPFKIQISNIKTKRMLQNSKISLNSSVIHQKEKGLSKIREKLNQLNKTQPLINITNPNIDTPIPVFWKRSGILNQNGLFSSIIPVSYSSD